MNEVPKWVIKLISSEKLTCNECELLFKTEQLMSIGVQESTQGKHNDVMCIGMFCPKCKELTIFELKDMSLVEFAFEILDQNSMVDSMTDDIVSENKKSSLDPGPKNNNKIKRKKSKITAKEIDDIRKYLKPKNLLHEDFLIAMGMSVEEVEKSRFKKGKKNE